MFSINIVLILKSTNSNSQYRYINKKTLENVNHKTSSRRLLIFWLLKCSLKLYTLISTRVFLTLINYNILHIKTKFYRLKSVIFSIV